MKTIIIGGDDVINVFLKSSNTGLPVPLGQYFQPGGDVICCFQRNDGETADHLSWSATGGNFPNTIVPVNADGGQFAINVPRQASSGWLVNDSASLQLELVTPGGQRRLVNLDNAISINAGSVIGC